MIKNTHSITVVVRPSQSQSILCSKNMRSQNHHHGITVAVVIMVAIKVVIKVVTHCHHHSCRDEHGGRVEVSLFLSLLSFASPQSIQPEHVVVTVGTVNIQIQCLHFRV